MKTTKTVLVAVILLAALALLAFFALSAAKSGLERLHVSELESLELALRRGAASCYALEGAYPPSLAYLCENYGISFDGERFAVFYEIFAENLMPEISVVVLEQ